MTEQEIILMALKRVNRTYSIEEGPKDLQIVTIPSGVYFDIKLEFRKDGTLNDLWVYE